MGLTSGKWQGTAWLEHRVKLSSAVTVRLYRRQRVTEDVFNSLATQSCSLSLLQVNWQERWHSAFIYLANKSEIARNTDKCNAERRKPCLLNMTDLPYWTGSSRFMLSVYMCTCMCANMHYLWMTQEKSSWLAMWHDCFNTVMLAWNRIKSTKKQKHSTKYCE